MSAHNIGVLLVAVNGLCLGAAMTRVVLGDWKTAAILALIAAVAGPVSRFALQVEFRQLAHREALRELRRQQHGLMR